METAIHSLHGLDEWSTSNQSLIVSDIPAFQSASLFFPAFLHNKIQMYILVLTVPTSQQLCLSIGRG